MYLRILRKCLSNQETYHDDRHQGVELFGGDVFVDGPQEFFAWVKDGAGNVSDFVDGVTNQTVTVIEDENFLIILDHATFYV